MSTIQETIDRLRELDRKASPEPWIEATDETSPDMPCLLLDSNGGLVAEGGDDWASHWFHIDNMVPLLTELRNSLPILLTEIERLTAENTQLLDTVAEAWAEGYLDKEAEAGGVMIHLEMRERAENPYKEDKNEHRPKNIHRRRSSERGV